MFRALALGADIFTPTFCRKLPVVSTVRIEKYHKPKKLMRKMMLTVGAFDFCIIYRSNSTVTSSSHIP